MFHSKEYLSKYCKVLSGFKSIIFRGFYKDMVLGFFKGFWKINKVIVHFFSPTRCKPPEKYSELLKQLCQKNLPLLKMYIHGLSGTNKSQVEYWVVLGRDSLQWVVYQCLLS